MSNQIHVPRIAEVTGKKSAEQERADREWWKARKAALASSAKHPFGSKESKQEWLRRIQRTRSF